MNIQQDVARALTALSLPMREARNIALASVLEPLSDKVGCVTRYRDGKHNTLEMFTAAGANIFPVFLRLTEHCQAHGVCGMYRFFPEAVLLSKANRMGGQINLGILEFAFPLVAAHAILDHKSEKTPFYVLANAGALLRETDVEDVAHLICGKEVAREISFQSRGKTYPVHRPTASSVYDYYCQELLRERESVDGHPTGVTHNKQFSCDFSDIRLALEVFENSTQSFSARLVEAYDAIMKKPGNAGIGPGLGADFIALTIYLALSYSHGADIIA